ncbi:MAG: hypothetical protein IJH50_11980 [Kiritimatiellae bacterium]|nr:hypothetical protein [Kiritimatiellia bacterium]
MKIQEMFKRSALLSALMATLIPAAADAGLKYWTAGNYDADSYVQDGLVLHYDGIRNMGLNADHSTTTTTWKNLGSGGATYDLRQSKLNLGEWGKDGFDFKGKTTYASTTAFTFGTSYTVQALIDAKTADHGSGIGYVYFPWDSDSTYWKTYSIGVRGASNSAGNRIRLNHYNYFASAADISGTSFSYVTALIDVTNAWFFAGTALGGKKDLASGKTLESMTTSAWGIGGNPGSTATSAGQPLFGTIKSYRHYNRALSEEERVWNRAVDDVRFFGKLVSSIPTTNAVIASSTASVSGNEKAGAYAVDASGYAFSAPASKTVDGRSYTCTGYTLETWDDTTGTWGTAQTKSGTSVAVTASDRIRITWQWTGGDGIVTRYTTADYVQDGLLLQYDGIRNVGADQPHSSDTTAWKNLAPAGGWDMTFHAKSGVTKPGEWRTDGYRFEQQSWFTPGTAFTLPSNQTVQIAVEANGLDQEDYLNSSNNRVNEPYLWYNTGTFDKGGSISLRRDNRDTGNEWFDWTTHGYSEATGNASTRPDVCQPNGTPLRYVTTVLGDDYTAAFIGTSIPTTTSANRYMTGAVRMALTSTPQVQTASGNGFYIGGLADNTLRKFRGTIHNFRFYNRVLTNEELAQNRVVDDYRFHGIMPVTNVVVATSHSFFAGTEANGNYEISGSYTFSAPAAVQTDSRGFEYTFAGYTLETWNAATHGWSAPVVTDGAASYTYTVGTSPAKVRLTWRWNCTKALRTAAGFGLEDVVPNGLVLHYDGIKNIGVESDDVTNPTSAWSKVWANLADPGAYTLSRQDKTTREGCWTDCGYAFTNTSNTIGGYFQYSGIFTFNPRYSLQVLVDAKVEDQVNATCGYLMFNSPWQAASMAIRTSTDYNYAFYYVADAAYAMANVRPRFVHDSKVYSYGTAIVDGKTATFFEGTEAPTSGTQAQGYYSDATRLATATNVVALRIGGGASTQDFTGTLKTFRYYDRVLTTDEMVRNRNVDSARYFGELATTNVFVVAGGEGSVQSESGAYKVDGEWTFSATKTVDRNGAVVDVVRYSTEELVNGAWANRRVHNGSTYTYTEGTDPATVRLTWLPEPLGMVIVIQ